MKKAQSGAIIILALTLFCGHSWAQATLVDGVWTPRRDAEGNILQEEWDDLPQFQWIEVAGSRLDSLDAEVKAAFPPIPGWVDRGVEGWNGVVSDWVGMAWDDRFDSERGWIAAGGGHNGSSNNGVYRLDIRKMGWFIEKLPDDPAFWSFTYTTKGTNSFTDYPPAEDYYEQTPLNPEGVYGDEIFDPNDPSNSTRNPTSRHTYGALVFSPDRNELMMSCRRFWRLSLDTKEWYPPQFNFDHPEDYRTEYFTGENMNGFWDETEGRYYCSATHQYGNSTPFSYEVGSSNLDAWRWEARSVFTGGYRSKFTGSYRNGRTWLMAIYEESTGPSRPDTIRSIDMNTKAHTDLAITLGTSMNDVVFSSGGRWEWWDGQVLCYIAPLNKYVVNAMHLVDGSNEMMWATVDATTGVMEKLVLPGRYPSDVSVNVETKVKYFARWNVMVWVNMANEIFIVRFGEGDDIAPAAPANLVVQ